VHTAEISGTVYWHSTSTGLHTRTANTGGELRIGYFSADTDQTNQNLGGQAKIEEDMLNYHRLDLAPVDGMCCDGPCDAKDADGKSINAIIAPTKAAVSFAPRLFKHPIMYTGLPENLPAVRDINNLLNQGTPAEIAAVDAKMTAAAVNEARASHMCHKFWSQERDAPNVDITRRYMGTQGGVFSVFPGQIVPKGYDSQHRAWYIRAEQNVDAYSLSRTEDALGRGGSQDLLTLSKSVSAGQDMGTFAVMGMDFSSAGLKTMLNAKKEGDLSDASIYLIDANGFVLLDLGNADGFTASDPVFIGSVNPAVAKTLSANNVFTQETCANYQSQKIESHLKITATDLVSNDCATGGSVELAPVPNSQIYVLVSKACADDSQTSCDQACPADTANLACPCESMLGYFICEESNAAEGPGRFETKDGLDVCGQTPSSQFFLTDYISKNVISTGAEELRASLCDCADTDCGNDGGDGGNDGGDGGNDGGDGGNDGGDGGNDGGDGGNDGGDGGNDGGDGGDDGGDGGNDGGDGGNDGGDGGDDSVSVDAAASNIFATIAALLIAIVV